MYSDFYGLTAPPFQLTPDHRFFFESSVHKKAVAHLMFGLSQGEGFIVITGEVGSGKTTLVGHMLSALDSARYVAARIVSTQLDGDGMLRMVAQAFGITQERADKATLLARIESFLAAAHHRGQRSLLLVDEAQNLSIAALEELRMLSNYQIGHQAPLQSFLLGQPQFRNTLASRDLDQLRQRVIASYHLGPMGEAETAEYIRHRLRTVGWRDDPELADAALAAIFRHTGGVPRSINTFCSRVMLMGCLEELHRIDADTIGQVADDLAAESNRMFAPLPPSGLPLSNAPPGIDLAELTGRLSAIEAEVNRHGEMFRRILAAAANYFGGHP